MGTLFGGTSTQLRVLSSCSWLECAWSTVLVWQVVERWSKAQVGYWASHVARLEDVDCITLGAAWAGPDLARADKAQVEALALSPDGSRILASVVADGSWGWHGTAEPP